MAASRDPLTSVANRGELETQLALMLSEFSKNRDAEPFSAVFLDIDHFKRINDTYGHGVGDQVGPRGRKEPTAGKVRQVSGPGRVERERDGVPEWQIEQWL